MSRITVHTLNLSALAPCLFTFALSGCFNSGSSSTVANPVQFDSDGLCPVGALHDKEDDFCYIECEDLSDEQCEALEQEVFANFDEYYNNEYSGHSISDSSDAVAQYTVDENLVLDEIANEDPDSDELFRQIWHDAKQLLPEPWLKKSFSEFHINSDGADGTLAYVQSDEYQLGRWVIAFDDADYKGINDKEFIHTVIHEFAHVIFLDSSQLNANAEDDCQNYAVDEGCTFNDSYLNRFVETFWTELFDEHLEAQGNEDKILAFYENYPELFISEYAATDPIEDAAEVFTYFVLREKPQSSESIINQKILFMHSVQILVSLRSEIRQKLMVIRNKPAQG